MSNHNSPLNTNSTAVTVLAVVLLILGGAVLGMSTYAYLTDTDSSSGNSAQAGTLDLSLDDNDGDVTTSFELTGAAPGESTSHTYDLKNTGSVSADHVDVSISASENDNGVSEPSDSGLDNELGSTDTQKHIKVVKYEYQDDGGTTKQNILGDVSDTNGNGIKDLNDVISQKATVDDLDAPQANGGNTTKLAITVEIADDSGSFTGTDEDVMGDGVDIKIDVTLNQDSSQ
jgi:predicted ribosomally synthesized peptide with SipW-like signal peptide